MTFTKKQKYSMIEFMTTLKADQVKDIMRENKCLDEFAHNIEFVSVDIDNQSVIYKYNTIAHGRDKHVSIWCGEDSICAKLI